jgi:hypothetical protein
MSEAEAEAVSCSTAAGVLVWFINEHLGPGHAKRPKRADKGGRHQNNLARALVVPNAKQGPPAQCRWGGGSLVVRNA